SPGVKAPGLHTSVLLGEQAVSKAATWGSNPRTRAELKCRRGSIEKGAGPVNRSMLVQLQSSALQRPDSVADRIGPSEGPGPGSTPGRDTAQRMCLASVTDSTAAFEAASRGSIPRRGT